MDLPQPSIPMNALRAACDALRASPEHVSSVSFVGRLPPEAVALPLLVNAERLGREYHFSVDVRLEPARFEIQFGRPARADSTPA